MKMYKFVEVTCDTCLCEINFYDNYFLRVVEDEECL